MNYTIDEISTALEQILDARERIPADREDLLAISVVAERVIRDMLARSLVDLWRPVNPPA